VHWFAEHGFRPSSLDELPPLKRDAYNHARKSKVLFKTLG
jgi:amino-acid N-acetyltransferase